MNLLIVSDSFIPRWDGISRFLYEIVPILNNDFKISLIAPKFWKDSQEKKFIDKHFKGTEIFYTKISNKRIADYNLPIPNKTLIYNEIIKADIIWTQTLGPLGYYTIKYSKKLKKPIINYVHSFDWDLVYSSLNLNFLLNKMIREMMKIYVRYEYNKLNLLMIPYKKVERSLRRIGIKTGMEEVNLGINKRFKPLKNKRRLREKFGLPRDKILIGYVGRINKHKNLIMLRDVFLELRKRYDIYLILFGEGDKKIIDKLKHEGIILKGYVNNPEEALNSLDIFVMPSLIETTSLSTLEAMATGLPVIASAVGFIPEYAKHNTNSMLFNPKDPIGLYHHLEVLINNKDLRLRIGKRARETVIKRFSWEKTSSKVSKIIKKIIKS